MRINLIKFLHAVVVMSAVCFTRLSAQVVTRDTTQLVAALPKKAIEYRSETQEANVIFPECLLENRDQSLDYIEKFSDKKRKYLLRTYEAGRKYFPKITAVLKQYRLPEELKVLVALESGFSGNAVSSAGAVGYWQIMDRVAKAYGLHITATNNKSAKPSKKKDERKNLNKSTLVAAKYLRDQSLSLDSNLLLMVASYNCGPGTVRSAIKKCRKSNAGFWEIKKYLPLQTRNYVMNFIALSVIFENYDKFESGQLLFSPKVIDVPVDAPETNTILAEPAVSIE